MKRRLIQVMASTIFLALIIAIWAVPQTGAARFALQKFGLRESRNSGVARKTSSQYSLPAPVRFREVAGRGLLIHTWVNGTGPYSFAIDTGAGATIISGRVRMNAGLSVAGGRATRVGGLSTNRPVAGQEAYLRSLAIGDQNNLLPSRSAVIVSDGLPPDIDGVLDPTESYWPLGYVIDMPRGEISAFDPRLTPLRVNNSAPGGAIVNWLFEAGSRRPFVMLDTGHRALIDTGSGFGLAISPNVARSIGIVGGDGGEERPGIQDIAGGTISARRISPASVRIGPLLLRRVPTDLLSDTEAGSPVLLGRDALRPFRLTFDPVNRLIEIKPGESL